MQSQLRKPILGAGAAVLSALLLAVALCGAVGAAVPSRAPGFHHRFHHAHFEASVTGVTSTIPQSFTVLRGGSTVTVDVTGATTYSEKGQTASFSDIAVGDLVIVSAQRTATAGVLNATHVGLPEFPSVYFEASVTGVTSTIPQSFTVLRGGSTVTVDVTGATTYSEKGQTASFSDIAVGDLVIVSAQRTATAGVLNATHVGLPEFPSVYFEASVTGVTSTIPQSFTVLRGGSTVTVDVTGATTYSEKGQTASFSDIAVGDLVIVSAQRTATAGVLNATHVGLPEFPSVYFEASVTGVTSTIPQSFTVLRGGSTVTVDVTGATTYSEKGQTASFSDIAVGDLVIVSAQRTATAGVLNATHVGLPS